TPLGAADQVAERVDEAVGRMDEALDSEALEAESAEAPPADETDEPETMVTAVAEPVEAETAAAEAAPVRPTPAPRVYEGPEPTTMEELLAEQSTEIRSLKHGDVVEGNVVRIDKDEILVDIGAKSEGVI